MMRRPMIIGNEPYPPKEVSVTRDDDAVVTAFQKGNRDEWTLTRDGDGTVLSMTDGRYIVTINRDENGTVTGTTVTPA